MTTEQGGLPHQCDWVKVRAECTLSRMLKTLRDEILIDIATRNNYLTQPEKTAQISFEIKDKDADFYVNRRGIGLESSVSFGIVGPAIAAIGPHGDTILEATICVSDEGRCLLRANNVAMETWQFRKKALENLFFPH
jgi:hypothetical protein